MNTTQSLEEVVLYLKLVHIIVAGYSHAVAETEKLFVDVVLLYTVEVVDAHFLELDQQAAIFSADRSLKVQVGSGFSAAGSTEQSG